MSDWKDSTWGELIELKYGKSLRDYKDGGGKFPVFGTNGSIGWWTEPLCEHPGIVIGRKGAYRGVHFSDKPFFVIDTAYYVEPLKDINLKWAYFHLIQQDINNLDSGSAIPSTSREDVYRLPVTVPPRAAQDQIADLLSAYDSKIELNRQLNRTLEQIAEAIFKSWFVDFEPVKAKQHVRTLGANEEQTERAAQAVITGAVNLEVITNAPDLATIDQKLTDALKRKLVHQTDAQREQIATTASHFPDQLVESELGLIPEGWEWCALYETAEFINGAAFKSKNFSLAGEGLPIIKIAELKSGIGAQTKFTTGEFASKYLIDDEEILYSWSGSPNTSLEVFKWFGGKGWLNQHIFRVCSQNAQRKYFVFFLLRYLWPAR